MYLSTTVLTDYDGDKANHKGTKLVQQRCLEIQGCLKVHVHWGLPGINSKTACRLINALKVFSTDPYNRDRFATWKIISSLGYQINPVTDCPSHAPSPALDTEGR
jgi:hypothetical protein